MRFMHVPAVGPRCIQDLYARIQQTTHIELMLGHGRLSMCDSSGVYAVHSEVDKMFIHQYVISVSAIG